MQRGIPWARDRWDRVFPSLSIFASLPTTLDRQHIREICAKATDSADAAKDAFLATMAWGYGNVGYGAWRVGQAFKDPDAGHKLLDVALVLKRHGPAHAYRLMAGPSRLRRIGPAFGTKFLYFADSGRHDRRALILDRLVAEWLRLNTSFRINPVPWAPANYDSYLDQMREWAATLEVEPDALELAIFQDMSERAGNQWGRNAQQSKEE
jgi:hypothetical protein